MDPLKQNIINHLQNSRKELLNIPKESLIGPIMLEWYRKSQTYLSRADSVSGHLLPANIERKMNGFWEERDVEVCLALRTTIVDLIDNSIMAIDSKQEVKPILEDLISKISDTKLSTFLKEFNSIRSGAPNLASAGFRTILSLIIRERAKKVDPSSVLATKDDINFEPDINAAVKHPTLFNSAEKKLLSRYLGGGDKDSFDNVVHKAEYLIEKDELEDAVNLLNRLLPTIIQ